MLNEYAVNWDSAYNWFHEAFSSCNKMCFHDIYDKDFVVLKSSHGQSPEELTCHVNCMEKMKLSYELIQPNLKVNLQNS